MYRLGGDDALDLLAFAVTHDHSVGRKTCHVKSTQGDDAQQTVILYVLYHESALIGMRIQHEYRAVSLCIRHGGIHVIHCIVS